MNLTARTDTKVRILLRGLYNVLSVFLEPKALKASSSKRQKATKAKTSKGATSTAAAKPTRRRKDLSLLPTVPLDVLYEVRGNFPTTSTQLRPLPQILRQLGPKDLLSLARTNKLWRKTVVNPETVFLWRDARGAYDAPEPPEGFTEEGWATLLFETACQVRSISRSEMDHFVDHTFPRRFVVRGALLRWTGYC